MSEKLLDLGDGLELHRAAIDELIEQDVNARSMPKQMFERLAATIGRDKRLESLPFCALTARGIEVVSGHHRTRGARAAGLQHLYILLDTTGLSGDQIKAKQLAHNAIAGDDNQQLLARIYQQIDSVDSRLESFIDPKTLKIDVPKVAVPNIDVGLKFQTASILFLPYQQELFEHAAQASIPVLPPDLSALYLAELKLLPTFKALLAKASKTYEVRNIGAILEAMSRIVLDFLGEEPEEPEAVSLKDVLGRSLVTPPTALALRAIIDRLEADGTITSKKERYKVLDILVAAYDANSSETRTDPALGTPAR